MGYIDIEQIFDLGFHLLDPGIIKFENLTGIFIDKMIMLFQQGRFFKLGIVCPELMFGNKTAVKQQFDGIV